LNRGLSSKIENRNAKFGSLYLHESPPSEEGGYKVCRAAALVRKRKKRQSGCRVRTHYYLERILNDEQLNVKRKNLKARTLPSGGAARRGGRPYKRHSAEICEYGVSFR